MGKGESGRVICKPCQGNLIKDWCDEDLPGLKYLLDNRYLCKQHQSEAEEKLSGSKTVKTYTLKKYQFLPPVIIKKDRNWTEREPNDGSLIE